MTGLPDTAEIRAALTRAGVTAHALDEHFAGVSCFTVAGDLLVLSIDSWLMAGAWRAHRGRLEQAARNLLGSRNARVALRDEDGRILPADLALHAGTSPAGQPDAHGGDPAQFALRRELERSAWTITRPYRRSRRGRKGAADRLAELTTIGIWTPVAAHMPVVRDPHAHHTPDKPLEFSGRDGTGHATFTPTLMHLRVGAIALPCLARVCTLEKGRILASESLLGRAVFGRAPKYAEASRLRNVLYDLVVGGLSYRSPYGARHNLDQPLLRGVYRLTADDELLPLQDVWQPDPEHRDRGRWLIAPADSGADETLVLDVCPEILKAAHPETDELGSLATLVDRRVALAAGRALPEYLRLAAQPTDRGDNRRKTFFLAAPMARELGYFTNRDVWRIHSDVEEDLQELARIPSAKIANVEPRTYNEAGHPIFSVLVSDRDQPAGAKAARQREEHPRVRTRRRRRLAVSPTAAPRRTRTPWAPLLTAPRRPHGAIPAEAGRLRARISALGRGGEDDAADGYVLQHAA